MISLLFGMLATINVTNYLSDTKQLEEIENDIENDDTLKYLRDVDEKEAIEQDKFIK